MANRKKAIRVICPKCGSLVTNECKRCNISFSVSAKEARKPVSRKKQDVLFHPIGMDQLVLRFVWAMGFLTLVIFILAKWGA